MHKDHLAVGGIELVNVPPSPDKHKSMSSEGSDEMSLLPSESYASPEYLAALGNGAVKMRFFNEENSEAERRLKFLAHTL